jgi:hypothetical protein
MGGAANLDMSEVTSFLKVAATIPESSQNDAVRAVAKAMAVWERQTVARTPVNTGSLRSGFSYKVNRGRKAIKGELINSKNYAIVVEKSRRKNKTPPPWKPIALWLLRKGYVTDRKQLKGAAIATAINIGKRGIPAKNMVSEGLDAAEPTIMKLFEGVAGDALKRLERS